MLHVTSVRSFETSVSIHHPPFHHLSFLRCFARLMRQCVNRRSCLRSFQRKLTQSRTTTCATVSRSRSIHQESSEKRETRSLSRQYAVFKKLPYPNDRDKRDPAAWAALLEPGLPPNLRRGTEYQTETTLKAEDIAEILLAARAQRINPLVSKPVLTAGPTSGIDLFFHLGFVQGRWTAVAWLIKHLVEAFGAPRLRPGRLSKSVSSWTSEQSLASLTGNAIDPQDFVPKRQARTIASTNSQSLRELTGDSPPENLGRTELLRHDAIGQIWRSLGHLTMACADGEIQPEILEIIAYLHHMEIMPVSIYNQRPPADATAVQQPVMLSLFSSRILISLSDAAWRVREKLVVDEAKSKGGDDSSLMPRTPASAYRVNVAGLRPEVWLELILWSCLHGGWIIDGTAIMETMSSSTGAQQWKPLSWRSLLRQDNGLSHDWGRLEYLFNTRGPSALDDVHETTPVPVHRTISSEIVNAYIDALLSVTRVGVGERGESLAYVLKQLNMLRKFLSRSGLSLGSGSWDAIVLRFIDAHQNVVNHKMNFGQLMALSPAMGEKLNSENVQHLPAYILDGSAATVGLYHRAMRSKIEAGDIEGTLGLFKSFQTRIDTNKRRSLVDFLSKRPLFARDDSSEQTAMFTSNFAGIDYPAFEVQVPPSILGPFLELITDAKVYEFGKWLLYSEEIDGPMIPERLYGDHILAPALVRFAAETNDVTLLSKLVRARAMQEASLPGNILQSFFESQINLKRWSAAVRILEHLADDMHWNIISLAHVGRMMLLQMGQAHAGDANVQTDVRHARQLFADMVQGKYEKRFERSEYVHEKVTLLLAMISSLNREWAQFCLALQPFRGPITQFTVPAKAFNLILEGVVEAYGSKDGRRLLGIFWPHSVRRAQRVGRKLSMDDFGEATAPRYAPDVLKRPERQRSVVRFPGQPDEESVIFYDGLKPDVMTIRIIFRKALEEFKRAGQSEAFRWNEIGTVPSPLNLDEQSAAHETVAKTANWSASGMIVWAVHYLRLLGMADEDIRDELSEHLSDQQMKDIGRIFPEHSGDEIDARTGDSQTGEGDSSAVYSPFTT